MDGMLTDGRTGKLWMCKKDHGHVLGLQIRANTGGLFIDQLLRFKEAISVGDVLDLKTVYLPEVQIKETIEGTVYDIACDLCDAKRTWWMGEAALERFMSARQERRKKVLA